MTKRKKGNNRAPTGFAGKYPLLDPAKGISTEELNAAIRHWQVMRRLGWILFAVWATAISVIIGALLGG